MWQSLWGWQCNRRQSKDIFTNYAFARHPFESAVRCMLESALLIALICLQITVVMGESTEQEDHEREKRLQELRGVEV